MKNSDKKITAHVLIKNEDRFIWFSVMSIIKYVDKLIIFDTGSTDDTIKIIENIMNDSNYSSKIVFKKKRVSNREELARLRQEMLEITDTEYFLILDGDEIWWENSIKELVNIIKKESVMLVAQHYINCAYNIYHYRKPSRDVFPFLDPNEAATIRLYSMNIPGIHVGGPYGVEGYFDKNNDEVQCGKYQIKWQNGKYLHTSFLQRSSIQKEDLKAYSRIKKLFLAYDYKFSKDFNFPEVFYLNYPSIVKNPFSKDVLTLRSFIYFILDTLKIRYILEFFRNDRGK